MELRTSRFAGLNGILGYTAFKRQNNSIAKQVIDKTRKMLNNSAHGVPKDGATRYIATSQKFSNALTSGKRKWANMHYRYIRHETKCSDQKVLLEVVNA